MIRGHSVDKLSKESLSIFGCKTNMHIDQKDGPQRENCINDANGPFTLCSRNLFLRKKELSLTEMKGRGVKRGNHVGKYHLCFLPNVGTEGGKEILRGYLAVAEWFSNG